MPGKFISLVGHQFGLLQVVEHVGFNKNRQSLYRCECICGEFITARGSDLCAGTKRRCGLDCKFKKEPKPRAMVSVIDRRGSTTFFGK